MSTRGITFLSVLICAAAARSLVWVGYDGGLTQYDDNGKYLKRVENYRRPIALRLDSERRRLWFLDAADYKLVCLDADSGGELRVVPKAAHPAEVGSSNLKIYMLEKRPVEPSLGLDPVDGSVWVADFYGHELARYDAEGKQLFRTGGFHEPFGVAPLGDGTAWIAAGIHTLSLIGPDGVSKQDQAGVNEARALAFDGGRALVWIADYRNNRILGIDRNALLKKKIGGVELPLALAVDGANGFVWVATQYGGLKRITATAEAVTVTIDTPETPAALTVDKNGRLWAAFPDAGEVVCYSPAGDRVCEITRIKSPSGVAAE